MNQSFAVAHQSELENGSAEQERAMRAKWPVLAAIVTLSAVYICYPYATLYRLDIAMRQADAVALGSLVDWYAVREGLKEDICDMAADQPRDARPSNELPPFGAGFVRGIAGNVLDQMVTPETVVSMTHPRATSLASHQYSVVTEARAAVVSTPALGQDAPSASEPSYGSSGSGMGDAKLVWAFFSSPTHFDIDVRAAGSATPIRMVMELRHMRWQVRRVWLPNEMLERATSGT